MPAFKDLTGERYNMLVAVRRADTKGKVKWICKCDCGSEATVQGDSLASGKSKSCGCLKSKASSNRMLKDILGDRFGRVIVESKSGIIKDGKVSWNCLCDCGTRFVTTGRNLRRGVTKSCGCLAVEVHRNKRVDISGERFGRLVALQLAGYKNGSNAEWEFLCDCGRKVIRRSSPIKRGIVNSCGCLKDETLALRHEYNAYLKRLEQETTDAQTT